MRTRLGNNGLLSDDQRQFLSLSEAGKNYRLNNPNLRRLLCYQVDGGIITNQEERCDYAVGIPQKGELYFIELKGKDFRKAASQVLQTLRTLDARINGYILYARIVLSRVQRPDLRATSVIALERMIARSGGDLCRASRLLEENVD